MAKRRWSRYRGPRPRFPSYCHKECRGMYSAMAAEKFGTVTWKDEEGNTYQITAYVEPRKYKWPDAVIVTNRPLTYAEGRLNREAHEFWFTPMTMRDLRERRKEANDDNQ